MAVYVQLEAKIRERIELMKHILALILVVAVLISANGCGKQNELVGAYKEAFNILFEKDPGLNGDITFIALQLDNLRGISDKDKDEIIKAFEEKGYEVKNTSLEELKESGEFDENALLIKNGILIRVDEFREFSNSRIVFEASKYRSGTGAIGILFTFVKDKGNWVLKDSLVLWIS